MQGRWRVSEGLFLSNILHGPKSFSYFVFFACGTNSKAGWTLVVPSQLIKQINGNYAVHIFRIFLFGCGEVCSYFVFVFADCSNFTWELISAWFLLTTSNCVDYNFLGQTP